MRLPPTEFEHGYTFPSPASKVLLLGPEPSVFMVRFCWRSLDRMTDVRIVAAAGVALTKTAPFWHPSVVAGGLQCL